jgi:hypothetical protein
MRRVGLIAFLLSLSGVLAAYLVADRVFERVPHVEDEMAYVWQAEVLARGQLTAPTPPASQSMMVPFVVDYHGHRFAKYPLGWPIVLSFGVLLGIRSWINPILGGLAIWLTFRLGQKIIDPAAGLLAALLTLTSPFFLINSGSLDSHPWSLVLSLTFVLAWMDTFDLGRREEATPRKSIPHWLTVSVAGLSLGLLMITRPLTAVGVALPFFVNGLVLLWRGSSAVRWRVLLIGSLALLSGSLFLAWQFAVTGNWFTDPYTLWWNFDRIGFGPGIGLAPGGHSLLLGLQNAKIMLLDASKDLFGWGSYSWLFLPFGLWAIRRKQATWLTLGVFVGLVGSYIFYWASVTRYGPRYYYESIYSLTLVSAAGILWLAGTLKAKGWSRLRPFLIAGLTVFLMGYNLVTYLPARFNKIYGLYDIHRAQLTPFLTPQAREKTPALVIVHTRKSWTEYAGLLELEDPWLTTPFIFAWSNYGSISDAVLAGLYPDRQIIYYYPDEPNKFFSAPR